ncbi:hypothetical protein SDC9_149559 [bioreactor metagenome]|uniref:Uncharacterized protein n=1 Tax=bioreactor metagenome TaxID=1076179 RepID=A0A645EP72_9ZZZZ
MIVFWCADDDAVSCLDLFCQSFRFSWDLHVRRFVEDRQVLDFDDFDVCLIRKMLLDVLQQHAVSGVVRVCADEAD